MNPTSQQPETATTPLLLGWREWVSLPTLGIPAIKAKMDTGARTSALHAFRIEPFTSAGTPHVRFWLHPLQKTRSIELQCEAPVIDQRVVKDSGGHAEQRYIIESRILVGMHEWPVEISLTDREDMLFRMLLGRTAMTAGALAIDPACSYTVGRTLRTTYKSIRNRE